MFVGAYVCTVYNLIESNNLAYCFFFGQQKCMQWQLFMLDIVVYYIYRGTCELQKSSAQKRNGRAWKAFPQYYDVVGNPDHGGDESRLKSHAD